MKKYPKATEWTHKKLVRRMAQWLKYTKRMTVVISELATRNSETPDVIGWVGGAESILIECKVSRADFLADGKKRFRRYSNQGVGDFRYIAIPPGIIKPDELPEKWGLLEVDSYHIKMLVKAECQETSKRNECVMLMSALRRLEIATAVYVVKDEKVS